MAARRTLTRSQGPLLPCPLWFCDTSWTASGCRLLLPCGDSDIAHGGHGSQTKAGPLTGRALPWPRVLQTTQLLFGIRVSRSQGSDSHVQPGAVASPLLRCLLWPSGQAAMLGRPHGASVPPTLTLSLPATFHSLSPCRGHTQTSKCWRHTAELCCTKVNKRCSESQVQSHVCTPP
jgi:hypothetical protein